MAVKTAQANGAAVSEVQILRITPPKFEILPLTIVGTAPFVQLRFGEKARDGMRAKQVAGSTAAKGKKRTPRKFEEDYEQAMYRTVGGRHGMPAAAFRNACIDACRATGFAMTRAKMSIFVLADDLDATEGLPLVHIESVAGPEPWEAPVRNQTGVADIRVRAMWREWRVNLRLRYDADQFTATDVANLVARAGQQIGVGEGRPFSRESYGMGFGTFEIANEE